MSHVILPFVEQNCEHVPGPSVSDLSGVSACVASQEGRFVTENERDLKFGH